MQTGYDVMAPYRGRVVRIGGVTKCGDGWRFIPAYQASPSRKAWPTPEAAVRGRVKDFTLVERVA